jgi:hypothetical protein
MKEAFDVFFEEMKQNWLKSMGVPPQAPCNEVKRPTGLFVLETLGNYSKGYAEWRPKLQEEQVSFENVEKELGFSIHPELKEFLSTYWFLALDGEIYISEERVDLRINAITPNIILDSLIKYNFNREQAHYLSDHNYFLLGTYCMIDGNDSYLVQFNNDTAEVTAVEVMDKRSVKLADSIKVLLVNMKGIR